MSLLINPDYRGRKNWAKRGVLQRSHVLMPLDGLLPPDRHLQPLQKSILLQISLKGLCQVKHILIHSVIDPWATGSIIDSKRKGL